MKSLKNKYFVFVFFFAASLLAGCGGGGGGGGTTAVSCTSYTPMSASSSYKISVKEPGIYLISPPTVKTFCLDVSNVSFTNFKLQNFDPGTKTFFDVPIFYDSAGNIEFYGIGVNRNDYTTPNADYTETNVYWLVPVSSPTSVPQMSTKSSVSNGTPLSPMTTFHLEQNNLWWDSMIGGAGYDHWFWEGVKNQTSFYNFLIQNYDNPLNDSSKIFVYLQAQGLSSHSLTIDTNTATFSTYPVSWSSSSKYIFSTNLLGLTNGLASSLSITNNCPPALYGSGPCYPTGEVVYFNWLELEYPAKALNDQLIFHGNFQFTGNYSFSVNGFSQSTIELFDISNPKIPLKFDSTITVASGYQLAFGDNLIVGVPSGDYIALTPAQRKTPAGIVPETSVDLKGLPGNYDYVMITHDTLNSGIQPLVSFEISYGFKVTTVNISDVYDGYSGGIFTPQAIQDFLMDVHSRWGANYVLLAGDASVDYKNYLGYGQENLVPTYLIDYSYGQTASDFWFVPKNNNQPQMAIGRLPAKNLTELNVMVNKIKNYVTTPANSWNYNLSFVAADNFDLVSESLISNVITTTPNISPNLIYNSYYFNATTTSNSTFHIINNANSNLATLNSYIINNDFNTGSLITNYFGHGSVSLWANGGGALGQLSNPFFQSSDLAYLNNSQMLTFLVTLDCLNGFFAGYGEGTSQTTPFSLAEAALKSSSGAIASFSPTGQGYTTSHQALASQLYLQILSHSRGLSAPPPPPGINYTTPPTYTIGNEIKFAEQQLIINSTNSQDLETVSIFVLLGDPATQLWVP